MNNNHPSEKSLPRRVFLCIAGLLLVYPLIRFINHRVPKKPRLVEVSGALNKSGFLTRSDFIIFSADQKLWAVSRTCTHLGCRLNYKEKEDLLECPCHQSRFTTHGAVVNGPAKEPLPRYPVELQGEPPTFIVTLT